MKREPNRRWSDYGALYWGLLSALVVMQGCSAPDPSENSASDKVEASSYVIFEPGNMPLIISVAHGGDQRPEQLPDRSCFDAVHVKDEFTIELALEIQKEFAKIGKKPFLVINELHRSKLDANRNRVEASCGDINAIAVWDLFHQYIQESRAQVQTMFNKGLYVDLHGHGNPKQRIELGYLLYEDELALSDEQLNSEPLIEVSSLQHLVRTHPSGLLHSDILRGERSLGSLLHASGYPAVPSAQDKAPLLSDNYFSGGYNTANYSSYKGGPIDGVQIECNFSGLRDTEENRKAFAKAFVLSVSAFLEEHYSERS